MLTIERLLLAGIDAAGDPAQQHQQVRPGIADRPQRRVRSKRVSAGSFARPASPGTPNPGRKQKPDRLSQRTSWRGDFLRPAATSMSTSANLRRAEMGHESLFAPSAASIWLARVSGGGVSPSAEPPKTLRMSCAADSTVASEAVTADERVGTGCGFTVSSCCACASSPRKFELQSPAMWRVPRFAPEFERANLSENGSETHNQVHLTQSFAVAQQSHQRSMAMYVPFRPRQRLRRVHRAVCANCTA